MNREGPPDFVCRRCGACCRAAGEVRLQAGEIESLAAATGLTADAFLERYTRLTRDRRGLTLTDRADGACIFLDASNACLIQHAKPRQCRDYPSRWRSDSLDAACEGRRHAGGVIG
jgi:Fe-S-cluster containining protein